MILNNLKCRIRSRLSLIGEKPLCNLKRDRAPIINGYAFILCYRCTGVVLGGVVATIIKYNAFIDRSYLLLFLFSAPLGLDYFLQELDIKISTNKRRLLTGLLLGFGLCFI